MAYYFLGVCFPFLSFPFLFFWPECPICGQWRFRAGRSRRANEIHFHITLSLSLSLAPCPPATVSLAIEAGYGGREKKKENLHVKGLREKGFAGTGLGAFLAPPLPPPPFTDSLFEFLGLNLGLGIVVFVPLLLCPPPFAPSPACESRDYVKQSYISHALSSAALELPARSFLRRVRVLESLLGSSGAHDQIRLDRISG